MVLIPEPARTALATAVPVNQATSGLIKKKLEKIADFLDLSSEYFIKYYLTKIHYRYSLKELKIRGNYQCVFFDDKNKDCSIYEVRHRQCRIFPFRDYFKNNIEEAAKECPGIKICCIL